MLSRLQRRFCLRSKVSVVKRHIMGKVPSFRKPNNILVQDIFEKPTTSMDNYSPLMASMDRDCDLIGENVVRFYPSNQKQRQQIAKYPSFAFVAPVPRIGSIPPGFRTKPVFLNESHFSVEIQAPPGTSFYGAGEVPGRLLINKRVIVTWNTDNPHYKETADRCYQAHPYILGVRPDGTAFGAIFDSTFRVVMDLSNTDGVKECKVIVHVDHNLNAGGVPFSVVIIERNSPDKVVTELGKLTGYLALPPKWSLGYHQCRWSYYPEARVKEIATQFRSRKIPCDVIWFDIHYMNGYRVFTFDHNYFPNPSKLNHFLHENGFHSVWMIDPGVKNERGYFVHDQLVKQDLCVKDNKGHNWVGDVWPGPCIFPDFTMNSTQEWWAGLYKDYLANGIDGVWNDMNEPAIFSTVSKTMPENNVHRGFGGGTHAQFHNVYGMLMIKATKEGLLKVRPEKRPFVLSRANYLGGQRYGATWTGDNWSKWNHLRMSISMILNLGISGQPFSGPDIGGFGGNADGTLFARWMGFGALLPFARAHTHHESKDHEPWSFGPETEETCRIAISRRYMLLPYLYTLFHVASTTGMPVVRPLFFVDPSDISLREEDRSFLLGGDLMVLVDVDPPGTPKTPFAIPKNSKWTTFDIDGHSSNKDLPELRIRRGSIVPLQKVVQFVGEKPLDELTLLVALNDNGAAEGFLYEDEGDGFAYEKNIVSNVVFKAQRAGDVVVLTVAKTGDYIRADVKLKVRLIHEDGSERVNDGVESGKEFSIRVSVN